MKYNFCTLFDSSYLTRGMALYESLEKQCNDFHLYIFAFDSQSLKVLNNKHLKNATIISLDEFEDKKLLNVKNSRSIGEYCWTATGSTIKYCIEKYSLESCTYLDADLYFFSNPKILLDEVADGSTLITEHRYTKRYDQSKSSGKYCVQFMTFHNNNNSMQVLNWWIDSCIDWCYARVEDGKFGDQKYLDDWTNRFQNVHELQHLGGGVAPWNVQQYKLDKKNDILVGLEKSSSREFELIFFHFHGLKFLGKDKVDLGSYNLNQNVLELIYKPYLTHLNQIDDKFKDKTNNLNKSNGFLYIFKRVLSDKSIILRFIKKKIFDKNNIYNIKDLIGK